MKKLMHMALMAAILFPALSLAQMDASQVGAAAKTEAVKENIKDSVNVAGTPTPASGNEKPKSNIFIGGAAAIVVMCAAVIAMRKRRKSEKH